MKWAILGLAIVATAAGIWWSRQKSLEPPIVRLVPAVRQDISSGFTADGLVQGKRYEIRALGSSRIVAIRVREGDIVRRGQVVADLDAEGVLASLGEAGAAVATARAQVRSAEYAASLTRRKFAAGIEGANAALRAAQARRQLLLAGARPEEIAQARHRIEQIRSTLTEAEAAANRARKLFEAGALSQAENERAAARAASAGEELAIAEEALRILEQGARPEEIAAAQAAVDAAKAEIELAKSGSEELKVRQTEVSAARSRLCQALAAERVARSVKRETQLTSPADGSVARLDSEPGETTIPGMPLMTIVESKALFVEAEIGDEDAGKIAVGLPVEVIIPSRPGRALAGQITRIGAESESKPELSLRTRILRTRIDLTDTSQLRPGMEVDVEGVRIVVRKALTVPADALTFTENRNAVYVVRDGKIEIVTMELGHQNATLVEILLGLKEGDRVVISDRTGLRAGMVVRTEER